MASAQLNPPDAATAQAARWLHDFAAALAQVDIDSALALFGETCFWRDFVAFTWNIHTCEGRDSIAALLRGVLAAARPAQWALDGNATVQDGVSGAWFSFETAAGRGRGYLRLKDGKCFTLFTALRELKGFEEKTGRNGTREPGTVHGAFKQRKNWLERRHEEQAELGITRQPYCLIVGGGQGGIALAARLRRLEVPTLVIEKNARAGDSWRKRYKSLCLHDPVWYDHMPYLPFPDHWPVFSPKDQIGDWLEMYVRIMEVNYWGGSACLGAHFDEARQEWVVEVNRNGSPLTLRPKQLILATGMSGVPNMPDIPGADSFAGTIRHSSAQQGGVGFEGSRCIVLGSNNSAHDICADLWEHGAHATMIQRSPTIVVRSEMLKQLAWGPLYSEEAVKAGITTELADLTAAALPLKLMPAALKPVYDEIQRRDAALYAGLARVGFQYHFGHDTSGIHTAYLRRGSGYYIDVGASQLIIDGEIGLKSGVSIARINPHSVTLSDGTELPADHIIYATGYGSMNGWAARLISQEVADKVGKCWGLGSGTPNDPGPWEGELRNMWKPTQQPGLWFQGGNLMQARHYSLYLALQLKARFEAVATPVYGLAPVQHLS